MRKFANVLALLANIKCVLRSFVARSGCGERTEQASGLQFIWRDKWARMGSEWWLDHE